MAKKWLAGCDIEYVVLDGMDHSTTTDETGVTEIFADFEKAKARARNKALDVPGTPFLVLKAVFQVKHPVGDAEECERS